MKRKQRHKKTKQTIEWKTYLPFFLSIGVAIFLKGAGLSLAVSIGCIAFGLVIILIDNDTKKTNLSKEASLLFFHKFHSYCGLLKNYREAFYKAVESLPLSHVKDQLNDYLENGQDGDLPLYITSTRKEYSLVSMVQLLYRNDEEYDARQMDLLLSRIEDYEEEEKEETSNASSLWLGILFASLLVLLLLSNYEA